jgi:hypothetical protein
MSIRNPIQRAVARKQKNHELLMFWFSVKAEWKNACALYARTVGSPLSMAEKEA